MYHRHGGGHQLVGGLNPLKNLKVNWDDEIPNTWKKKMFQTTNQSKNVGFIRVWQFWKTRLVLCAVVDVVGGTDAQFSTEKRPHEVVADSCRKSSVVRWCFSHVTTSINSVMADRTRINELVNPESGLIIFPYKPALKKRACHRFQELVLWISKCSDSFPMFSHGFLMFSYGFPVVLPWFSWIGGDVWKPRNT